MTKRFTIKSKEDYPISFAYVYDRDRQINLDEVVELLNTLHEENEQLKWQCERLKKMIE